MKPVLRRTVDEGSYKLMLQIVAAVTSPTAFILKRVAMVRYSSPNPASNSRFPVGLSATLGISAFVGRRILNGTRLLAIILTLCLTGGGCRRDSVAVPDSQSAAEQRPLRALRAAMRDQRWQQAWELSDAVLREHPDDPEVLAKLALVAHQNEMPGKAADLLVQSCRAESFEDGARVLQAMIAMIGVGRLHEGMQMLEQAVQAQPQQHETRRWLYDFYMGTENRVAGVPHGRYLIRQRQFDLELLQSLSNTERRTQDAKPLDEMTSRNPDDKRPLLGKAKIEFDEGNYEQAIETLRTVVAAHPDYLPAQALLGRVLASAGKYEAFESWSKSLPQEISRYPGYWVGVGDWARSQGQTGSAARAYWEATQRDPDMMESWSKLTMMLEQLDADQQPVSPQMLDLIKQRTQLLSKFNQLKTRFERTGNISRAVAEQIATTLVELGRLWEAEAWAAIALSLPEDDSVPIEQTRQAIVAQLRDDTPWYASESHPELNLKLTELALPPIAQLAGSTPASTSNLSEPGDAAAATALGLRLINEAADRGLIFFGRTGEHLDQPGIMLYETLGCGGGTLDFDLDGWSDLYLVAAGGTPPKRDSEPNALMRNEDGRFVNVTQLTGTGDCGFGQGVAVGDINEDGFADLLVLNYGDNALFVNNGDGTFSDESKRIADAGSDWSTSGAIADIDGDGLSDLAIVNYCAGLGPVDDPCPMEGSDTVRACTPIKFPAAADQFLKSSGNGQFVNHTDAWDAQPDVLGRGLGIVVGCFDDRPGLDLHIANDMTNNHYWSRGDAPGDEEFRLVESAVVRGLGGDDRALAQGSMGIATGDFDRDGDIDFYVTNFDNEYNTYYLQQSSGIWQDSTANHGLIVPTMPMVGFGSEGVDLDHDGVTELLVTNGHVDMFSRAEERSVYEQPMQIFRRNDADSFESIVGGLAGEYVARPHVGRAMWTLDANRDGLCDFAVTHQTEPTALLINHSRPVGDWVELKLVGRQQSRDAIGAVVTVTVGDQSWTVAQTAGDGYLCSNDRLLRIGLGQSKGDLALTVGWPDGFQQELTGLQPNRSYLVVERHDDAFRF